MPRGLQLQPIQRFGTVRTVADTHFPESIRENVPEPWQAAVLAWIKLKAEGFIPSVYLDHDFVQWVAESGPSCLNNLNPSYGFFRTLSPELTTSFGPGDAVSISFDTAKEAVLFLGEGRWDSSPLEPVPKKAEEQIKPFRSDRVWRIGIWPGLDDFDA